MEINELKERLGAIDDELKEILDSLDETEEDAENLEERSKVLIDEKRNLEIELKKAEAEIEKRKADEAEVLKTKKVLEVEKRGKEKMEIRNSAEYLAAFANYIKSGDDREVRSLLTENATNGTFPVPELVENAIRTAWDNDEIMKRVRKTELRGNVKVGFEISATGAVVHTEGAAAPTEETLSLGICNMVPETIKKWITFSDEILDMNPEAFLEYIYSEIAHKIIKKAADIVVNDIVTAPTTATATKASVTNVTSSGITDFITALSTLSDEASNPVIIMNKASYAYYKGLAMSANYGVDPFDGMEVLFNNTLAVISGTSSTGNFAIVGDLNGYQANFPNGYEPTFITDELSLAEKDLVKVVGRMPMGHGVVACGHFAVVKKS